jgi:hypothetical protein
MRYWSNCCEGFALRRCTLCLSRRHGWAVLAAQGVAAMASIGLSVASSVAASLAASLAPSVDSLVPMVLAWSAAIAVGVALISAARERSRMPRARCCPGPARRWTPLAILFRRHCAYDLGGHVEAGPKRAPLAKVVTCPECGRAIARRSELVRSRGGMRPLGFACLFLLLAFYCGMRPPVDGRALVAMAPTDVLLSSGAALGTVSPIEVREELHKRALDLQFDEGETRRYVELLVADLRDDGLLDNARRALDQLAIFATYDPAPLLAALASGDEQQRDLATEVLCELAWEGRPPPELVNRCLDDLRSDERKWNHERGMSFLYEHAVAIRAELLVRIDSADEQERRSVHDLLWASDRREVLDPATRHRLLQAAVADLASSRRSGEATEAFHRLFAHANESTALLLAALNDSDERTRFLAAALLGCASREAAVERAAPILIAHLADNAIIGDGIVAARALWGFGDAALPAIDSALASGALDEQAKQALGYIRDRRRTTLSVVTLQHRYPLARLTLSARDALTLKIEELRAPRWPVP